jgi:hypothetical protein
MASARQRAGERPLDSAGAFGASTSEAAVMQGFYDGIRVIAHPGTQLGMLGLRSHYPLNRQSPIFLLEGGTRVNYAIVRGQRAPPQMGKRSDRAIAECECYTEGIEIRGADIRAVASVEVTPGGSDVSERLLDLGVRGNRRARRTISIGHVAPCSQRAQRRHCSERTCNRERAE